MPLPFTFSGPYLFTRLSLFMGSNPKVPFNHSLLLKVQDFMIIFSLELVVSFVDPETCDLEKATYLYPTHPIYNDGKKSKKAQ